MLYAMTNKLHVEKKSSNCSSGYQVGTLKTITVLAALYKQVGADWELMISNASYYDCSVGGTYAVDQDPETVRRWNEVKDCRRNGRLVNDIEVTVMAGYF